MELLEQYPPPPYLEPLQPGHGPEGAEAAEGSEDLHGGHPLEPHVGQHLVGNGKLEWYQIKENERINDKLVKQMDPHKN